MSKKKQEKGSWIVRLKATVTKEVYCNDCTEEEARESPYDFASTYRNEVEIDCEGYEVISVEPNG